MTNIPVGVYTLVEVESYLIVEEGGAQWVRRVFRIVGSEHNGKKVVTYLNAFNN